MTDRSIRQLAVRIHVAVVAICLNMGPANSGEIHTAGQRSIAPQQILKWGTPSPQVLSPSDALLYRKVFQVQKTGNWKKAEALISQIKDRILLGHVLAQRFLHPTKYRSRYKELRDWMAIYADHPDAVRIYKLALRRRPPNWLAPAPPATMKSRLKPKITKKRKIKGRRLTRAKRQRTRSLKSQIRRALRRGHTLTAKRILQSPEVKQLFSTAEYDEARAKLGHGYFKDGRDQLALKWAGEAAKRSGHILPIAHWTAGLAAWRLGLKLKSAKNFEKATRYSKNASWFHSASAFWAARANLVTQQPNKVNSFLQIAASKPRTFYGLLALKILGLPLPFKWTSETLDHALFDGLKNHPRGKRAMALLQIDESRRAGRELRNLGHIPDKTLIHGVLTLADQAGMAELAVKLEERMRSNGRGFTNAAYPIPRWAPSEGFRVDRALIYALMRQESRFNPTAKSWAGARGLMQLMPRTAQFVARAGRVKYSNRSKLFVPRFNLTLGQRYIKILLKDPKISNGLFLMMAAWNAGPGNLNKWRRRVNYLGDPLFFIESLPSRETRNFIEHVFANLWIYRHRLGQTQPSLNDIAAGQWPVYIPLDDHIEGNVASKDGKRARY